MRIFLFFHTNNIQNSSTLQALLKDFRGHTMVYFIIIILSFSIPFLTGYFIYKLKKLKKQKYIVTQRTERAKGERGEEIVARILGETISNKQYVLHNLLFKIDENRSCEIDHIFINKFGVWVIETKNYAGIIYGNEKQLEWTQVLKFGTESKQLYNPIKQNATHIYHLSQVLKMQNIFHNIVVFLNADISNMSIDTLYTQTTLSTIKNQSTKIQLSVKQMEDIYYKLLQLKESRTITKEEHIQNIHRQQAIIKDGFCPRCGRKLVIRHGKYSNFYGCPNYPKCKFTKNLIDNSYLS